MGDGKNAEEGIAFVAHWTICNVTVSCLAGVFSQKTS